MRSLGRLGLRSRLAVALATMAVLAVALATAISTVGVEERLSEFARDRLETFAAHSARGAAARYRRDGALTRRTAAELRHLARLSGFVLVVEDRRGRLVGGGKAAAERMGERAGAPIQVAGREVGRVVVATGTGKVLGEEERSLRDRLDRLHLLAGLLAGAIAVLVALVVAPRLTGPMRRLIDAAQRMGRGDLSARVEVRGGGREMEALARTFNRLSETLEREEEIRRESAADLAHELRGPVTGLLGRIEAAQDGIGEGEGAGLEAMHTEALRLVRFIEDLGRLAEAERPGLTVGKVPLELSGVARRVARKYVDLFQTNGLEFREELGRARIRGDERRLEQIIDNLLSNALRYTERGGCVSLRVMSKAGGAVLEVEDTGIGIPPEDLPHVFKRFWRGEKSRSRATGGAGIGLAIVRELVLAHEGRVDIESTPGSGSCFRVLFPRA